MSMSRNSYVVKFLDDDSGSDDGLNLETRRIMRERRREQKRIEQLGPLLPIDDECSTTALAEVEDRVHAIPVRKK